MEPPIPGHIYIIKFEDCCITVKLIGTFVRMDDEYSYVFNIGTIETLRPLELTEI